MKQPDFTKQAKRLLKDIQKWNGVLEDSKIIETISQDLRIFYLKGRLDCLKEQIK